MNFFYTLLLIIISCSFIYTNFFTSFSNIDASSPWQLGFQDPATPVMEGIITFHHDLMFFFDCNLRFRYVVNFSYYCFV